MGQFAWYNMFTSLINTIFSANSKLQEIDSMNKSKCPICGSMHTIKYGSHKGIQTYKCTDCGYRFRNVKFPSDQELWTMYQVRKQTIAELSSSLGVSLSTIKRRLRNIDIKWEQPPLDGHGFVHLDATYWGRNDGILVALDSQSGTALYLAFIKHERVSDYIDAVNSIESRGYMIDGIIIDGMQTLFSAFSSYKIQMCQFHMKQIIKRYLTKNPRLLAARSLNDLMKNLSLMSKEDFIKEYTLWKETWIDTLNKRSQLKNGKTRYRHRRLRTAMRSIDFHLPYLFTYQESLCKGMPNTNNKIEGTFTDLKKNLNNHSGMREMNRKRFISGFFLELVKPLA